MRSSVVLRSCRNVRHGVIGMRVSTHRRKLARIIAVCAGLPGILTMQGALLISKDLIMRRDRFIGTETGKELVARGDTVYGLARSPATEQKLRRLGALPVPGDVYQPEKWLYSLPPLDYVINV